MNKILECANCRKELSKNMEVEYSAYLTEYFCCPNCARDYYFRQMESIPLDMSRLSDNGIKVIGGKLVKQVD